MAATSTTPQIITSDSSGFDSKEYKEAFTKELYKQLKKTFKHKAHLTQFASKNQIKIPYGVDKATAILKVAEFLAVKEMHERFGLTKEEI